MCLVPQQFLFFLGGWGQLKSNLYFLQMMWSASLWKLCEILLCTHLSKHMVNFRVKRECQLIAAPQTWIALVDGMIKSIYWILSIKDVLGTATIFIYFQRDWKLSDQVAVWLPTTSQIFGRKPNVPLDWLDWGNWRYFKFLLSNQRVLCSDPVFMYDNWS